MPLGIVSDIGANLSRFALAFGDNVLYNIIFQVVAAVPDKEFGEITKEIEVQPLAVNPNNINYTYPSRVRITQTPGGAWKDSYGMGLTRVTIVGEFGQNPRLVGAIMKSGYRRMIEFKDRVMKWSNLVATPQDTIVGGKPNWNDRLLLDRLGTWATQEGIKFYLNFYDFYQREFFSVNADSLQIVESARRNNLPSYTVALTEIGRLKYAASSDPTLVGLWTAEQIIEQLGSALEDFESLLDNAYINSVLAVASTLKGTLNGIGQLILILAGILGQPNMQFL